MTCRKACWRPTSQRRLRCTTKTADRIGAWAYRARGLAHANLGESQAAVADYRSYLDLSPGATDRDQVQAWIADLT